MIMFIICILQLLVLGSVPSQGYKLSAFADAVARLKRDRGDLFSDAGGPLASSGKNAGIPVASLPDGDIIVADNSAGGSCVWQSRPREVISEIAEGSPNERSFKYLGRGKCTVQSDCNLLCISYRCNYYFKSSVNGVMYMYSVSDVKFSEGDWDKSITYDSFVLKCAAG